MISVCTWLWGNKYGEQHVAKLAAGVRRNLRQAHRFIVFADRAVAVPGVDARVFYDPLRLCNVKGCLVRLQMFSPQFQREHRIDDRLVCMDLDNVITGPLDELFDRPEPFVIFGGANAANPCPYNGSLMMLRPGAHADVFDEFNLEALQASPKYEFHDDQGWIWHKVPNAATWKAGPSSGVYGFDKPGWPKGTRGLPNGARMVCFFGWRSPEAFASLDWVGKHWRQ